MNTMEPLEKAEIEKDFRKALVKVRQMMTKNLLSKEEISDLYGLFQQATVGNCNDWKVFKNVGRSMLDLESKSKYAAWVSNRGLKPTDAMQRYTTCVDLLITKYGVVFPSSTGSRFGSLASLATTSTALSDDIVSIAEESDLPSN